jgi:hypothetical protein
MFGVTARALDQFLFAAALGAESKVNTLGQYKKKEKPVVKVFLDQLENQLYETEVYQK